MTLPLERARSRKPVTWLTLLGVLLLPVVIGGILVTALYNPVERLDSMRAAIVNNDEPVTIDDQYVPLGRQLTAGLVEGSDELASNLDWTISNPEDARSGLADGTYDAVITIPENFSAAATSTAPGGTPERATISVETAPDSLIVDDAITAQVTQAAASIMGEQLSTVYLENVLLGFTTLGDQLGEAAGGAQQLADGATQAADGAASLPDGATQIATGVSGLGAGVAQLGDGAAQLGDGAAQLAGGATDLSGGATQLQSGLTTIAGKTRDAAAGAGQIADGVDAGAAQLVTDGLVPAELTGLAAQTNAAAVTASTAATGVAAGVTALSADCAASGADAAFCDEVAALAAAAAGSAQAAAGTATLTAYTQGGLAQFAAEAPQELAAQFGTIADSVRTLGTGLGQLAGGVDQSATGAQGLASGATQLSQGATGIADGATGIADGATGIADGATQLADGATALADGATQLVDGVVALADGTSELATGLDTAAAALPSYTDREATDLATVVANPVTAAGIGTSLFGASAIPLLAMLALWFGGLASFVALQAVPRHALSSRRPSVLLAARSLAPAAGIGALQGLLVAGIVQLAAGYDWGAWSMFAVLAVVAGVAFAAVNQALVAVFGGAGRWIAALIGVLAVATGVVSTVPGALSAVAGLMPTTPAYTALLAALTPAGGIAAGLVGMLVWAGLAFVATVLAVVRRRTTSARAILGISPALA